MLPLEETQTASEPRNVSTRSDDAPLAIDSCPRKIQDYIIAHELAHFKHDEHSDAFWNTVGRTTVTAVSGFA